MSDSIKNTESTQTDYKADCAVTPSSGMAFAKEANYIKDASDVELIKDNGHVTAYEDELSYKDSVDLI